MSQPYESVSRIEVHFADGSCAIVKNLGMDANAAIAQLRRDVAELEAYNKRLRNAGDAMHDVLLKIRPYNHLLGAYVAPCEPELLNAWLAAKGVQS